MRGPFAMEVATAVGDQGGEAFNIWMQLWAMCASYSNARVADILRNGLLSHRPITCMSFQCLYRPLCLQQGLGSSPQWFHSHW